MPSNEVEIRGSSEIVAKSDFRVGLEKTQKHLDKVAKADKALPPKPAVRFHGDETSKHLRKKFYRHYDGPEQDLVSINNLTGLAISLPPSIALTVASVIYFMSLGTDLGVGEAFIQVFAALPALLFAVVAPIASVANNGPVVSLRNQTINRKRYRRELSAFVAAERKKADLYDAAIRKRDKKIERIRKSLEPLSAQYAQANPGKRLSFRGDTLKILEYEDKKTQLSNVELLAARVS